MDAQGIFHMNSIDTRIAVEGMAASVGARSQSASHSRKMPVKDTISKAGPDSQFDAVQTDVSFSTYGFRNEHIAFVVTDMKTGKVIREIPTKEMQKLHGHLDVLV
jgi:uncharacterized FlaG/YvyC family protein